MADPFSVVAGTASFVNNQISSALNSHRAWKYYKKQMRLQDQYNRNMIKDYYGLNRESLTSAGYNPLLAVPGSTAQGANYGASMSIADSDAGDQAITSAINAQTAKANINTAKSQTQLNNANSSLAKEQAETEKSKRIQMDFSNAESSIRQRLLSGEADYQQRRFDQELLESMERVKSMQAQSAIGMLRVQNERNDIANRYKLGKYHNETERGTIDYHLPFGLGGGRRYFEPDDIERSPKRGYRPQHNDWNNRDYWHYY